LITAADTSVLLDVIGGDKTFGAASADGLRRCLAAGRVTACDVVWAECTGELVDEDAAVERLGRLRIGYSPTSADAAVVAGSMWRKYRIEGGPRGRMIADFLIGAHALTQADRLLTRDRGFYRRYFEGLEIVDPSA
jgi:predicted nucleic acid-binding protein